MSANDDISSTTNGDELILRDDLASNVEVDDKVRIHDLFS